LSKLGVYLKLKETILLLPKHKKFDKQTRISLTYVFVFLKFTQAWPVIISLN